MFINANNTNQIGGNNHEFKRKKPLFEYIVLQTVKIDTNKNYNGNISKVSISMSISR